MLAGIQLGTDEIGQLLCPGNPYRFRNTQCRGGRGLMGCMHITDLMMTLTGEDAFQTCLMQPDGCTPFKHWSFTSGREDVTVVREKLAAHCIISANCM